MRSKTKVTLWRHHHRITMRAVSRAVRWGGRPDGWPGPWSAVCPVARHIDCAFAGCGTPSLPYRYSPARPPPMSARCPGGVVDIDDEVGTMSSRSGRCRDAADVLRLLSRVSVVVLELLSSSRRPPTSPLRHQDRLRWSARAWPRNTEVGRWSRWQLVVVEFWCFRHFTARNNWPLLRPALVSTVRL